MLYSRLILFFTVKWFFYCERRTLKREFPFFFDCYQLFKRAYRFCNPFRISKIYLKSIGASDLHQYGETPLPALAKIAKECHLTKKDRILELGCGRGIGCFFLHQLLGCRVIGVDWVPLFIQKAREIYEVVGGDLQFICDDISSVDLTEATAIYLFGTCLEESLIAALIERFKQLPCGVKIITISYPLSDYDPAFACVKEFSVRFPWGEADVYLNVNTKTKPIDLEGV